MERQRVLQDLISLRRSLEAVEADLRGFSWDSQEEVVQMTTADVLRVLERALRGDLTANQIEQWANLIESREDVGFSSDAAMLLAELVFDLANPSLNGPIDDAKLASWIRRLVEARS